MLQLTINGQLRQVRGTLSILQALRSLNIEIPSLCYDQRMKPFGGCRLCVVRVNGSARPVIACGTQISDGMTIDTHTREIEEWRQSLLRLLAQQYPAESLHQFPDKEFHRLLRAYGLEEECLAASRPNSLTNRIPIFVWTCLGAFTVIGACASATRCRDNSSGRFGIVAMLRGFAPIREPLYEQVPV